MVGIRGEGVLLITKNEKDQRFHIPVSRFQRTRTRPDLRFYGLDFGFSPGGPACQKFFCWFWILKKDLFVICQQKYPCRMWLLLFLCSDMKWFVIWFLQTVLLLVYCSTVVGLWAFGRFTVISLDIYFFCLDLLALWWVKQFFFLSWKVLIIKFSIGKYH